MMAKSLMLSRRIVRKRGMIARKSMKFIPLRPTINKESSKNDFHLPSPFFYQQVGCKLILIRNYLWHGIFLN